MFTGLIEKIGKITKINKDISGTTITVENPFKDIIQKGASIAINGVCLTVSKIEKDYLTFDIMNQSLINTNLGNLKSNDIVNIERAMSINDRFDGHIVTGHIDCCAKVKKIEQDGFSKKISFICDNIYIVEKGSIAVNGVSLTVASILKDGFCVSLIPTTQKETNLQYLKVSDKVNIEYDILGKYMYKYTNNKKSGITLEYLKENGF